MALVGVPGWVGSEAVGQLFSDSERFAFTGGAHQVPYAPRTPLL